jgi:hypothetical protein
MYAARFRRRTNLLKVVLLAAALMLLSTVLYASGEARVP